MYDIIKLQGVRWLSWRFGCYMVSRHHTWISWLVSPTCPVVADFGQLRHTMDSYILAYRSPCVTPTARATIPANNYRSMDISSCCITPLELIAIRVSDIQSSSPLSAFRQRLKTFLFIQSFLTLSSDYTIYALVVMQEFCYFSHVMHGCRCLLHSLYIGYN